VAFGAAASLCLDLVAVAVALEDAVRRFDEQGTGGAHRGQFQAHSDQLWSLLGAVYDEARAAARAARLDVDATMAVVRVRGLRVASVPTAEGGHVELPSGRSAVPVAPSAAPPAGARSEVLRAHDAPKPPPGVLGRVCPTCGALMNATHAAGCIWADVGAAHVHAVVSVAGELGSGLRTEVCACAAWRNVETRNGEDHATPWREPSTPAARRVFERALPKREGGLGSGGWQP
jgi:hypothetical protein